MNTTHFKQTRTVHFFSRTWILVALCFTVALALAGMLNVLALGRQATTAPLTLIPLEDTYAGSVDLDWVSPGVYSDTLVQPPGTPPDLGRIDLGFLLHCSEGELNGYIDLSYTLVFTTTHVIDTNQSAQLAVGPWVSGTCGNDTLQLQSERFSMVTDAGQNLMRQFRLTGGVAEGEENRFVGEYRETLWGYGLQPLTIVGEFELTLLSGKDLITSNKIYLPVIQR